MALLELLPHLVRIAPDHCWIWCGPRLPGPWFLPESGYGRVWYPEWVPAGDGGWKLNAESCWVPVDGWRLSTELYREHVVHRVAWEVFHGRRVPDGRVLHHECRRQPCFNVFHLTPMTPGDHARLHLREQ